MTIIMIIKNYHYEEYYTTNDVLLSLFGLFSRYFHFYHPFEYFYSYFDFSTQKDSRRHILRKCLIVLIKRLKDDRFIKRLKMKISLVKLIKCK